MTWYNRLICSISISATGVVAEYMRNAIFNGLISKGLPGYDLDGSVSKDVVTWFNDKFGSWINSLLNELGDVTEVQDLIDSQYTEKVNEIIAALYVARSFYAKAAEEEFVSSLQGVSKYKVLFCEEIAKELAKAYERSLGIEGESTERTITTTIASDWNGTAPEKFTWPNHAVIAYHIKFNNMENTQSNQNCNSSKQYLPWVFTAAFGLIAWSAAASKTAPKQTKQ